MKKLFIPTLFFIANLNGAFNFANQSGTLRLRGANSKLTVNDPITDFGGTLDITDDNVLSGDTINFDDGVFISNTLKTEISGGYNPATSTFSGNTTIELNEKLSLTSDWILSAVAGETIINGNGNILDMSGGTITLANDHVLYLNNVDIKGLTDSGADGKFIFGNDNAQVRMNGVSAELAGDYTLGTGQFYFEGSNSNLLAKSNTLAITGSAILTVDGIALTWDKLNSTIDDSVPILPAAGGNQVITNGGVIRSVNSMIQPTYIFDVSSSLGTNIELTTSSPIYFTNDTPGMQKEITLNGGGHFIHFSRDVTDPNFVVGENVILTLSNVVLKDFNPEMIDYQGAGATLASIVFGDDVTLELGQDITITDSFVFNGNGIIDGNGAKITLSNADSLLVSTAGKTLTVRNANVHGINTGRIRPTAVAAGIVWQNSNIFLDSMLTLSTGFYNFKDKVNFSGKGQIFAYSSAEQSSIDAESQLTLNPGLTLRYNSATEDNIKLTAATSALHLNGATLNTTSNMTLDTGRMIIEDHAHIIAGGITNITLKTDLNVEVLSAAIMDIQGSVVYST